MKKIDGEFLEQVLSGYLDCLVWTMSENDNEGYTVDDIENSSKCKLEEDLSDFLMYANDECWEVMNNHSWQWPDIGHNFALTRNGHGTGFWDRGLGDVGDTLTTKSESFGSLDLYENGGYLHAN